VPLILVDWVFYISCDSGKHCAWAEAIA